MEAGSHGLGGSGLSQAGLVEPGKSPSSCAPHVTSRLSSHQHWPSYRLESTGSWEGRWHFLTRTTDAGHLGRWHVWGQGSLDLGPAVPPFEAVLLTLSCCGRSPACLVPATSPHTQGSWTPNTNSSQELPSEEYNQEGTSASKTS